MSSLTDSNGVVLVRFCDWVKRNRKDILAASITAVCVFVVVYIALGFAKSGLSVPYTYRGDDDTSTLATAKEINDYGWFWMTERMGAPFDFGANFSFSASLLQNVDRFIMLIVSLFTDSPAVILNVTYLLIFPLCAINAYIVLRVLKIGIPVAIFGASTFALAPYIFFRGIMHLCLSTCFLIPFSILLCVWAYNDDDNYLTLNKGFWSRGKNIATIILCFLIANNGIAYYPIFTCFFLVVVAICRFCRNRKLTSIVVPLKLIYMIAFFFILAVLPHIIYVLFMDGRSSAVRTPIGTEVYALKIAQLFMPIESHGISSLSLMVNQYNSNMPLVNENQSAYLGIAGICGFVISIILLFVQNKEKSKYGELLYLASRMNICAILLATIGGFSSLIGLVFSQIRCYNRISIFISFISIMVLCVCFQMLVDNKQLFSNDKRKAIGIIAVGLFLWLNYFDLIPTFGSRDVLMQQNKALYESDKAFVEEIEERLGEGAMVFQLPYHGTPECGQVNEMLDYHHYIGYIHSDTLKWSFGLPKNTKQDNWYKTVGSMPYDEMIDHLAHSGFTGIYIDNRAYPEDEQDELHRAIGGILGQEAFNSDNGNLSFYDLTEYIEKNSIVFDEKYIALN